MAFLTGAGVTLIALIVPVVLLYALGVKHGRREILGATGLDLGDHDTCKQEFTPSPQQGRADGLRESRPRPDPVSKDKTSPGDVGGVE